MKTIHKIKCHDGTTTPKEMGNSFMTKCGTSLIGLTEEEERYIGIHKSWSKVNCKACLSFNMKYRRSGKFRSKKGLR